jgi:hypothetical protein
MQLHILNPEDVITQPLHLVRTFFSISIPISIYFTFIRSKIHRIENMSIQYCKIYRATSKHGT